METVPDALKVAQLDPLPVRVCAAEPEVGDALVMAEPLFERLRAESEV